MTLTNSRLSKIIITVLFLLTIFSGSKDIIVKNKIISEATQMIKNTSKLKSKNVIYLYSDNRDNDSIIGIAYGLPVYEKNKYYLKRINHEALLIEKSIYNDFFKAENLKFCNDSSYLEAKITFLI